MEKLRKWTMGVSIAALILQAIPILRGMMEGFNEGDGYIVGYAIGSAIVLTPYILTIIFTSKVRVKE